MATQSDGAQPEATLKPGAIGFVSSMVIGLASTSPAYSLAAIIGPMVALVGIYAPGALLASFVPMLLIASAFYYLNRVDSDCGTTFSWVTRAMGPWFGWLGGWAIGMTGVLVVGSLANVGVTYALLAFGADDLVENSWVVNGLTVALIIVMTAICVFGTELSAHFQDVLIIAQVLALLAFAGTALYGGLSGTSTASTDLGDFVSTTPEISWLNPFGAGGAALTGALLLGVFAYWGWESAVNLNEETEGASSTPGRAAIASTFVLLVTYVGVAVAVVSYAGVDFLADNAEEEEAIFGILADQVMGGWSWVVLLAVSTSAIASTQTTIIPASRTGLSMARRHAMPKALGHIHPRFRTPDVSTWTVAVIAIVWYLVIDAISENALFDSLTALSLLIAFYYGLTGIACAIYYRRELTKSLEELRPDRRRPRRRCDPALLAAGRVHHRHVRSGQFLHRGRLVRRRPAAGDRCRCLPVRRGVHDLLAVQGRSVLAGEAQCRRPGARRRRQSAGQGFRSRPVSIVLGYDESPGARRALNYAIDLARLLDDTLVLVYGAEPPSRMGEEFAEHFQAIAEQGRVALHNAVDAAKAAGVTTIVELVDEKPAQALLTSADKHDARLIVVGTYGESPLRGAMLGSTPHKLLHWSSRPVLCVPPPDDEAG